MPAKFSPIAAAEPKTISEHEQKKNAAAHEFYSMGKPSVTCCNPLYMRFFFDGTKNNLIRDHKKKTHSNVARLYRLFLDSIRSGFARTYVPGVGTAFPEVGDPGSKEAFPMRPKLTRIVPILN